MSKDEEFLVAVLSAPIDIDTQLVYADWLEEQGDPRGEYLRLLAGLDDTSDPDCSERPRQRLRELRASLAPDWADAVDRTRLLVDGLYQSDRDEYFWGYLRFYPDGTVLTVTSTGTPAQVWRWLTREGIPRPGHSHGTYTLRADELTFSAVSFEGRVDYAGVVGPRTLALRSHSHINGHRGKYVYRFVDLAPTGPLKGEHEQS